LIIEERIKYKREKKQATKRGKKIQIAITKEKKKNIK